MPVLSGEVARINRRAVVGGSGGFSSFYDGAVAYVSTHEVDFAYNDASVSLDSASVTDQEVEFNYT